jgi:RNA polymerase sigma factor FliA
MFLTKPDISPEASRDALIESYFDETKLLAKKLVRTFAAPDYMHDGCYSAAIMGLISAANRYDAERGIPFPQYANNRIRGAILDEIRTQCRMVGLKRCKNNQLPDADFVQEHHYDETSTYCSDQHRVAGVLDYLSQGLMSIQCSTYFNAVSEDLMPDAPDLHGNIEDQQFLSRLNDSMQNLPLQQRRIIQMRYQDDLTYDEIAERFGGKSRSWVSRQHAAALRHLKKMICQKKMNNHVA